MSLLERVHTPSFAGATEWLNSEPLGPAELEGHGSGVLRGSQPAPARRQRGARVVTFVRLVQSSIEDLAYANRIALLRSFYLRVSPELEPYLVVARPAASAPAHGERLAPSKWQLTLTAAGMVAVVNSVVVAACAGLVLEAAGVHSLAIPVAVGTVFGAAAFTLHERHHRRARDAYSPGAVDRAAILISPPQGAL
jgi:hypothetical protein